MKPSDAYKFCLLCGGTLEPKESYFNCMLCGHREYINPKAANGVILENEKGEILLVKRKGDPKKGYYDVPGGFIDAYETLETSVKREIKEELGLEIEMTQIIDGYSDTYLFDGIEYPTLNIMVAAKIISGEPTPSDDIDGYQYFSKEEVLKQKIAFPTVTQGIKDYLKLNS